MICCSFSCLKVLDEDGFEGLIICEYIIVAMADNY
jgi:hypothetical protein